MMSEEASIDDIVEKVQGTLKSKGYAVTVMKDEEGYKVKVEKNERMFEVRIVRHSASIGRVYVKSGNSPGATILKCEDFESVMECINELVKVIEGE